MIGRTLGALVAAVLLTGWGPRESAGPGPRVYVPNQNDATVSIVDVATGTLVETVDLKALGFSPNAKPHHALPEPDGSAWYVSLIGDGVVVKLDRENRVVGRARTVTPGMLALDPSRDMLYASRSMTAVNAPASIAIIRTGDMTLLEDLDVIVPRPHAIAADSVSGRVYVAGLGDNRIATVDERGQVTLTDVPGPNHVYVTFALSPDGRRLAASTQLTSRLLGFALSDAGVPTQIGSVEVLPFGYQIAYTPDGRSVWLGDQRSGAATEVDASAWRVAGVVTHPAFAEPHGVAVSADGRTVFVSSHGVQADSVPGAPASAATHGDTAHGGMHNDAVPRGSGTLVVIDARTRQVRQVIPVGRYAAGIGIGGGQ